MASLSFIGTRKGKGKRDRRIADVAFASLDGDKFKRPRIRLGRVTVEAGEEFRRNVERLIEAKTTGCALGRSTAEWLAAMPAKLYGKLVRVGLVEAKPGAVVQPATPLGPWLVRYIGSREQDVKAGTLAVYDVVQKRLESHFGKDRDMATVTLSDALEFQQSLRRRGLASNTIRKTVSICRQFWARALKTGVVAANVFDDSELPTSVEATADRVFVDREWADQAMAAMPDRQWRLIFALSRFGGLRCTSEHYLLRWEDIDFDRNRFTVRSPKTERHKGRGTRVVPLFDELRDELEAVPESERTGLVVTYQRDAAHLRVSMYRILKAAKVKPWPRVFHNLRMSRQTELTNTFPAHVVCNWLGNTVQVANKHYLVVTEEMMRKAVGQDVGQPLPVREFQDVSDVGDWNPETSENADCGRELAFVSQSTPDSVSPAGEGRLPDAGSRSGLNVVIQRWGILPESVRRAIVDLAHSPSEIPQRVER